MSSHFGRRSRPAVPPLPVETLRLFSPAAVTEEFDICRTSDTLLKITRKVYSDGSAHPHLDTRHLDLTREAVILQYAVTDNTDVAALWHVRVIYGTDGLYPDDIEYYLLSEQDAFTFQRLVTGYSPQQRFKNVSASALEQHTFRRATTVDSNGEVQLWWPQPLESPDEVLAPPGPAPTRRGSMLSAQSGPSIRSRFSIQTDLKGRELSVTMAEPPPLLALFGRGPTSNGSNRQYHMWRVDITNLQCRVLPEDPQQLDLISYSSSESTSGRLKPFDVYVLAVQDLQFWNVCRIRPGSYWRYFERHACDVLTLNFRSPEDVGLFWKGFVELQAKAMGISPPSSPSGSRSASFSTPPSSHTARPTPDPRNGSLGSLGEIGVPAPPPDSISIPNDATRSFQEVLTVSEYRDPTGTPTVPGIQPALRIGNSQDATNFVEEEPRDGMGLRTRPGQPILVFTRDVGEHARPSRRGWHSSTASQAGSQGGLRSLFRSR